MITRMFRGCLLVAAATLAAGAAEARFSRGLAPEDFRAAGLGKLTADELARLDALVGAHRTGRAVAAEPLAHESRPRATRGETASTGSDARVVVAPGTKVEFAAVESRLTGNFTGWEPRGVFALENGQRWREANGTTYVSPPLSAPKVRITPGAFGAFWLEIEGVRVRVKVVRVDTGR